MPEIDDVLRTVPAEHVEGNLLDSGIATVTREGREAKVTLCFPYPGASAGVRAARRVEEALGKAGIGGVTVEAMTEIASRTVQGGVERIEGVKNVIAVASAKGGVGKSMVAANLALAFQAEGASAGLLDADIYGPSVPVMLGGDKPEVDDRERLVPLPLRGIKALSMGHLVDEGQAVIWRAPMVVRALQQLLRQTAWDGVDFLILDMPPGTGDVQLSVAQQVPVTGAVIVTTPHELALADAQRGVRMFGRVSIPVLGYVANMTTFTCPGCGTSHELFGAGAASKLSSEMGLEALADLPLDPRMGMSGSSALVVADEPGDPIALAFRDMAVAIGVALLEKSHDRSSAFPKIVVSDD